MTGNNDPEAASVKVVDATIHAEYGARDSGAAGKDITSENGLLPHESSDPGPGKRCPVSVIKKDLDPHGGHKIKITVLKHFNAIRVPPDDKNTDARTTKTEGLAESVFSAGSVDGTADTAEIGLMSKVNGSEATERARDTLVRSTVNMVSSKSCKVETEEP